MGFTRVLIVISFFLHGKCDKIRCYCNLDECKSQDYSCAFENGGCFSDFLDYRDFAQAKHGCLHLLDRERQAQCSNAASNGGSRSLLLCCQSDMCNHVLSPVSLVNHSLIGSLMNATEGRNTFGRGFDLRYTGSFGYSNNEIWFKAATIAVPICGAMILLMLVALAFKILRTDQMSVRKYGCDPNSNANSLLFGLKSNDGTGKDLSKKVPLLYETRQTEIRNSEDFRNFTSARIHYGQNVNVLKEKDARTEKNLENAKMYEREGEASNAVEETNNNEVGRSNASGSQTEGARELSTLSLNLEKNETTDGCNLYRSPRGRPSVDAVILEKLYDKYLI